MHKSLPFEIGQLAEVKCFTEGYRSAWFRCKILGITRMKGQIVYALEYYDYPDEKMEWIEVYQKPPNSSRKNEVKKELMLRPNFPPIYNVNELPDINVISEVIVAVSGVWRVGDFVDWLSKGCFWSGTITETLDSDMVKIKFPEPPVGEGSSDCVSCKDIRPSLDWSPELGWTVPTFLGSQIGHSCACLIQPLKQDPVPQSLVGLADEDRLKKVTRSSSEVDESASSLTSSSSLPRIGSRLIHPNVLLNESEDFPIKELQQTHSPDIATSTGDSAIGEALCANSLSSTYVRDVMAEVPGGVSAEEQHHDNGFSKQMQVNETILRDSTPCHSMEGAIVDLEEVVNRVKWLRQILKFGVSSNFLGPTWKFLEHSAISKPK